MHLPYYRYERDELNQMNLSVCSTQTEAAVFSLLQSQSNAASKVEGKVDIDAQ
jgi:hypothetical protein